jgi:hypothetical protein
MMPARRVAVLFFGLPRALKLTIGSIRQSIYAANQSDGFSFCSFASLNLVQRLHNPRTGELDVALDPADAYLLDAQHYALVPQEEACIGAPLAAAQRRGDAYDDEWSSTRNLLQQLISLQRAWSLCSAVAQGRFDFFLFVRPDLKYLDDFPLAKLAAAFRGEGNIALPGWQRHGGFNDRFAFADAVAARCYAERLSLVAEYCEREPLHAERLLAYALAKGDCQVCALPVRAQRIRAQGNVVAETFSGWRHNLPRKPQRFSFDPTGRPRFRRHFFM